MKKKKKKEKKNKNINSKRNLAFFSAVTVSEHKIVQILHRKGQNKMWTQLSSLGQEPTFKAVIIKIIPKLSL